MLFEDLPAPLLKLKILIWVHAALGGLLLLGIPGYALVTDQKGLAVWALPALFVWCLGVAPLRKRAEGLAPEDRIVPKGLPLEIPVLVGVGGLFSPLSFAARSGEWVFAAWLLLFVTIAIRWGLSRTLAVPVHRRTWGGMLVALAIPLGFVLLIFLFVLSVGME